MYCKDLPIPTFNRSGSLPTSLYHRVLFTDLDEPTYHTYPNPYVEEKEGRSGRNVISGSIETSGISCTSPGSPDSIVTRHILSLLKVKNLSTSWVPTQV